MKSFVIYFHPFVVLGNVVFAVGNQYDAAAFNLCRPVN